MEVNKALQISMPRTECTLVHPMSHETMLLLDQQIASTNAIDMAAKNAQSAALNLVPKPLTIRVSLNKERQIFLG